MVERKTSIKEYTKFVAEKCNTNLDDDEVDKLMFSFGFKYNQEV